jgi:hypothetical protein
MGIKNIIYVILITLFCLKFSSCFIFKDTPLTLEKKKFESNSIKTDGYYFSLATKRDWDFRRIYFFYKNGITWYGGSFDASTPLDKRESKFKSIEYNKAMKNDKTGWGVFHIDNDKIQFETWEPSSGGPLKTVIRSGQIINDTSFVITNLYGGYTKRNYPKNDTFYFHAFSPKPDSTNAFIK